MTCEHYWREGVLRIELGEADPHRDTCLECHRAHAARDALVQALPLVGSDVVGDPQWQARVWAAIARAEPARARGGWFFGSAIASAMVLVIVGLVALHKSAGDQQPVIEVMQGPVAMRSTSPSVGDRVRITVKPGAEVRVYHAEALVLWCPSGTTGTGCISDGRGTVAEVRMVTPGDYELLVITPGKELSDDAAARGAPAPMHGLALDLQAVVDAHFEYQRTELTVH